MKKNSKLPNKEDMNKEIASMRISPNNLLLKRESLKLSEPMLRNLLQRLMPKLWLKLLKFKQIPNLRMSRLRERLWLPKLSTRLKVNAKLR